MKLDPKIPSGPLAEKWDKHRFEMKLVNPANKRKYTASKAAVILVKPNIQERALRLLPDKAK